MSKSKLSDDPKVDACIALALKHNLFPGSPSFQNIYDQKKKNELLLIKQIWQILGSKNTENGYQINLPIISLLTGLRNFEQNTNKYISALFVGLNQYDSLKNAEHRTQNPDLEKLLSQYEEGAQKYPHLNLPSGKELRGGNIRPAVYPPELVPLIKKINDYNRKHEQQNTSTIAPELKINKGEKAVLDSQKFYEDLLKKNIPQQLASKMNQKEIKLKTIHGILNNYYKELKDLNANNDQTDHKMDVIDKLMQIADPSQVQDGTYSKHLQDFEEAFNEARPELEKYRTSTGNSVIDAILNVIKDVASTFKLWKARNKEVQSEIRNVVDATEEPKERSSHRLS